MGDIGPKTRSVGQIMEKPCEHSRSHSFGPIFIQLAQNDHLDNIYLSKLNMGHVWSKTRSVGQIKTLSRWIMDHVGPKTRSVGQIMEKPGEHSRGHSFGPNFIELGQD